MVNLNSVPSPQRLMFYSKQKKIVKKFQNTSQKLTDNIKEIFKKTDDNLAELSKLCDSYKPKSKTSTSKKYLNEIKELCEESQKLMHNPSKIDFDDIKAIIDSLEILKKKFHAIQSIKFGRLTINGLLQYEPIYLNFVDIAATLTIIIIFLRKLIILGNCSDINFKNLSKKDFIEYLKLLKNSYTEISSQQNFSELISIVNKSPGGSISTEILNKISDKLEEICESQDNNINLDVRIRKLIELKEKVNGIAENKLNTAVINVPITDELKLNLKQKKVASIIFLGSDSDYENFFGLPNLKEIKLENIKIIKERAFWDDFSLEEISAPATTKLEGNTFEGCYNLTKTNFPKVNYVGYGAFLDCSKLEKITLSQTTKIENGAFTNCTNLKEAILPKLQVFTDIRDKIFYNCPNIEKLDLRSLKTFDVGNFEKFKKLKEVTLSKKCKLIRLGSINESHEELVKTYNDRIKWV